MSGSDFVRKRYPDPIEIELIKAEANVRIWRLARYAALCSMNLLEAHLAQADSGGCALSSDREFCRTPVIFCFYQASRHQPQYRRRLSLYQQFPPPHLWSHWLLFLRRNHCRGDTTGKPVGVSIFVFSLLIPIEAKWSSLQGNTSLPTPCVHEFRPIRLALRHFRSVIHDYFPTKSVI